jgi:hypothetical protein
VVALVASLPLLGHVVPAAADAASDFPPCTREPSAADIEGAAGSHRAAKAFYERADYDRAIQLWRDAYGFDCTKPAVFLNVANAYEKKGDKAAAVAILELYLTRAPKDAPDLGTIAAKVNNLKSALKTEPTTTATAPTATASATTGPAPTSTGPDQPTTTTMPGERPFGFLPWIPVGVGGAALLGGAILLPVGIGMVSDAEAACPSRRGCSPEVEAQGNDGITNQNIGGILLAVGGAAVVGGLVWQFVFNKPRGAAASVQVVPMVAHGQAGANGVGLHGSF